MARLDITFGRPELRDVKRAAVRGDYPALGAALTTGLTGPHDRIDRVITAADILTRWTDRGVPDGLDDWVRSDPGNGTALVVRGAVEVHRAWNVRGAARAKDTKPQQLRDFVRLLGDAEGYCRAATRADPRDPAPWLILLHLARGQHRTPDDVIDRRDALEALVPQHFDGHRHAVIALGPKWGGSTELADTYVRQWTNAAPAGSLLPALVFVAGIQRWWAEGFSRRFTKDPSLREQAYRASELLPSHPCRSIEEIRAHNYAAGWYSLSREPNRAMAHFKLLRGYATDAPWSDFMARSVRQTPLAMFRGKHLNARLRLPL